MRRVAEYHILRELQEAGTSRIFRVEREGSDGRPHTGVLKVFHDRFRRNSLFTSILFAEAPAARDFRHPVAVPIWEVADRDGRLFVAMDEVRGVTWGSFRERARQSGLNMSVESILFLGLQLTSLLQRAHQTPTELGDSLLVGRLSPNNLMLTCQGELRVLGVGLGRALTCLPVSRHRLVYQAPELFLRSPASTQSDIYNLGLFLYEGCTGEPWLELGRFEDAKSAVFNASLPEPTRAPAALLPFLHIMLSKEPLSRPADLEPLGALLREGILRSEQSLVAEWAENVKSLFPEMVQGPDRKSGDMPARPARVSVPYSSTSARPGNPDFDSTESRDVVGPPVSSTRATPSSYDIEDLADALASGDLELPDTDSGGIPASRRLDRPPTADEADSAERLKGLVDSHNDFDVDSVVDLIMGGRTATPPPDTDSTPRDPFPPRATRDIPSPSRLQPVHPFPPVDAHDTLEAETPTDPLPPEAPPPRKPPESSPWSSSDPDHPVERMSWGARFTVEHDAHGGGSRGEAGKDASELQPGDVVHDRYRIVEELGRGGMSIVYRAEHTLLLQEVAMKLLRPELSMLTNVVERFQREARSVCRLDDPNIVRVTDFGRTERGLLYLVMNLIEGRSLTEVLEERGRLDPEEALPLVDQVLSALEHAHKHEIVHRDLKPENIMMVERDGQPVVKILDFGIAKLGSSDQKSITQAGTVFGTPRYMSPEQAAGEPVDHRTDLYTVGVILYQLLTGRVPFEGDSTVQLLAKVLTQDPPPMDLALPPVLARQLEGVVTRALAKEPDERFDTARSFREALRTCLP